MIRTELVSARTWTQKFLGVCPAEIVKIRKQVAEMLRKKKTASSDDFSEVEDVELAHQLVLQAPLYSARLGKKRKSLKLTCGVSTRSCLSCVV